MRYLDFSYPATIALNIAIQMLHASSHPLLDLQVPQLDLLHQYRRTFWKTSGNHINNATLTPIHQKNPPKTLKNNDAWLSLAPISINDHDRPMSGILEISLKGHPDDRTCFIGQISFQHRFQTAIIQTIDLNFEDLPLFIPLIWPGCCRRYSSSRYGFHRSDMYIDDKTGIFCGCQNCSLQYQYHNINVSYNILPKYNLLR